MENVVITISRQYGSGGKTIAAMLAQKLGVNFYSRDILKMASEDSGINEELLVCLTRKSVVPDGFVH